MIDDSLKLFSLKNMVAVVTGAYQGIGFEIAKGLKGAGSTVIGIDCKVNDNFDFKKVDLLDKEATSQAITSIISEKGTINILVNCAGITISNPSENYSITDWQKTLDINLTSVFFLSQLVAKNMIAQQHGGSIINISSIGAVQGFPHNPAYCASKGGVEQLTKALALDWGNYQIRVNNLGPGYTNTEMNTNSWNDIHERNKRANATFLGRWANPTDFVGAAIFLASDASQYVTGTSLYVDGGWLSKGL